jgi:hypothetical protein
VSSGKKQAVTNREKDSIRGRMADTGEPFNVARRKIEAAPGFFDNLPAPEPALLRRHLQVDPALAQYLGQVRACRAGAGLELVGLAVCALPVGRVGGCSGGDAPPAGEEVIQSG